MLDCVCARYAALYCVCVSASVCVVCVCVCLRACVLDPGGGSTGIHIHNVWIHNGDDSVAVKPSGLGDCTREILVESSHFEFGHGCSIGSVGSGCVENVLFRNITMANQENGCRVKTYSEQAGHVRNITWADITVKDTGSCVTVNANYKPLP